MQRMYNKLSLCYKTYFINKICIFEKLKLTNVIQISNWKLRNLSIH